MGPDSSDQISRKNSLLRSGALIRSWLAALLIASGLISQAAAKPHRNRSVIVISLDGFPASALDDPRLPVPTLRKLAREGAMADSMRPINPTVTWPNHTAMVTGVDASKHHLLFNGLLIGHENGDKPTIEPWRDKDKLVHAPTIYDVAYQAGLTTAQVDWVAIYGASTITWQFPELPEANGSIERELITDGVVTADQLKSFEDSSQSWQDEVWTAAAVDIIEKHHPNLLLFHLLTLDDINHAYGPMTPASFTAAAFLDAKVKQIVEAANHSGNARNTTLIVVSDHGFRAYYKKVRPNVLLKENQLLGFESEHSKAVAWVVPEGGTAGVYVLDRAHRTETVDRLSAIFAKAEGVEKVYAGEELKMLGYPAVGSSDQAPDLVLAARADYMFSGESEGDYVTAVPQAGTHGYINTDPQMQAIFIANGAGIPRGVRLGNISNLDVAPTIAALLGLQMKGMDGHAIPALVYNRPYQAAKE
jgi:predicted AlkP superfamily pyrophosphatase or phosphodiesterase